MHCTPLPPAHSSCCSIKCRDVSVTHGGRSPCYAAKRPSVPSSADIICLMEKLMPHILTYCNPDISRPPILRRQNCPKFFDLYASIYGRLILTDHCSSTARDMHSDPILCTMIRSHPEYVPDHFQNSTKSSLVHNGNDVMATVWRQCREHC